MADDTQQQPQQQPLDQQALLQALIQQAAATASGQTPQVQLPSLPAPQAQTQYSNDPSKGPDLLERIGLALGGGSLPGAPAELRAQMGRQALMNFGIGLMSAGKFATPGEVLAGGLRGAQGGLLGSEAAQAGQQEYALNAQGKLLGLGIEQQKARTEALQQLVPLLQMQGRLGLPPLFGPGSQAGPPGGGPGGGPGTSAAGDGSYPTDQQPGWSYLAQLSPDMQKMVQAAAAQTGMPVELLAAHKWNESRGQSSVPPNMQDPGGGSFGIMQMGKAALDDYNAKHNTKYTLQDISNDPQLALNVGAGHWKDLQQQYGGNSFLASMAYARGPGATDAWVKGGSKYGDLPPGVQRVLGNVYGPGSFPGATPIPEALALNQRGGQGGGQAGAPGGPVGPYKVASRDDVAPPSAPASSALPEPPQPPAEGVPLPGNTGLRLYPDGSVGTPGQQGRPAITAEQAPGGQKAPPPDAQPTLGPITTPPPAAQPPAPPAAQPPAAQPPTAVQPAQPPAPTPAPASRAHDYSVQDTDLTPEEYQDRHFVPLTPEQVKTYAPGPSGDLAAAAAEQVQRERANLGAMQTQLDQIRRSLMPGDVAAQARQVNEAQGKLDAAENQYNDQVQKLAQSGSKNLLDRDNAERQRVSADYKASVIEPRNAAALAAQQGQQKINEIIAQSGETQKNEAMKGVNTQMLAASDRIDQLQLLRGLSENAGDASVLSSLHVGNKSLADIVSMTGFGTEALKDKASAVQAFRNGVLNLVRTLREGGAATGEPRSNQDLQFVMDMAPGEWQDPNTRSAIISYLQQVNQRHIDLGAEIGRLTQTYLPGTQTYMPFGQAVQVARDKLGDMVPQVPKEIMRADPATQWKWFGDNNIKPYTFFRYPNGKMDLYKGPPAQ